MAAQGRTSSVVRHIQCGSLRPTIASAVPFLTQAPGTNYARYYCGEPLAKGGGMGGRFIPSGISTQGFMK